MDALPDLSRIFFADDDERDEHADDSCCLSLDRDFLIDDKSKWAEVRDQHIGALHVLASQASNVGDERNGWWLSRPLVFAAHHAMELSLKTATISRRSDWPSGVGGHNLVQLLQLDRDVNGGRVTADWEDQMAVLLDRAWEAGRYPETVRRQPLFDNWCCVSASALDEAVTVFAALTVSPGE